MKFKDTNLFWVCVLILWAATPFIMLGLCAIILHFDDAIK